MNEQAITSNLLGSWCRFRLPSGGWDDGEIRAIYLSRGGAPMLLVADRWGKLVVTSHDSTEIARGSR